MTTNFLNIDMQNQKKECVIEWTAKGLEVQRASVGMPFLPESDVVIVPSYDQFQKFIAKVLALDLSPQDPEPYLCDGFEVNCHITFQNTLVKFDIINPEFHNFLEFRNFVFFGIWKIFEF